MMKTWGWMLLGLFGTILFLDIMTIWIVRGKIITVVEHALDAALIEGVVEEDLARGRLLIDEEKGRRVAARYLEKNLGLDTNQENSFLKNSVFAFQFSQDGERARVMADVKTTVKLMAPLFLGLEGIELEIHKTQYHICRFK
jgi:hypothetical protein